MHFNISVTSFLIPSSLTFLFNSTDVERHCADSMADRGTGRRQDKQTVGQADSGTADSKTHSQWDSLTIGQEVRLTRGQTYSGTGGQADKRIGRQ